MWFRKAYDVKILDTKVNHSDVPSIRSARLIYVDGAGRLRHQYDLQGYKVEYFHREQIVLNGVPLIHIHSPGCATTSSLLCTGWGIEHAECPELTQVRDVLNQDYIGLDETIEGLTPLLTLLKSGLYMIADVQCFPTDGDGRFFWDVPNELTDQPTTAVQYMYEIDCAVVGGQPVYVYPTQSAECYCEERVQYYMDRFQKSPARPRAIVYKMGEFLNMILDGHHKACAAARLGEMLDCIQIIPCSYFVWNPDDDEDCSQRICFGSVRIRPSDVPLKWRLKGLNSSAEKKCFMKCLKKTAGRQWEKDYLDSPKHYPTVEEYAMMIELGMFWEEEISDEQIAGLFENWTFRDQMRIATALTLMAKKGDSRLKKTAITCINQEQTDVEVLCDAYRALATIKDDEEVEQIFIDYLVDHSNQADPIVQVIDQYWK